MTSLILLLLYLVPCFGQFIPWSKYGPEIIGSGPVIHLPPQLTNNPKYAAKLDRTPIEKTPDWYQNWKKYIALMRENLNLNQPIGTEKSGTSNDNKNKFFFNTDDKLYESPYEVKEESIDYNTVEYPDLGINNKMVFKTPITQDIYKPEDYREIFNPVHDQNYKTYKKPNEYNKQNDLRYVPDLVHLMDHIKYKPNGLNNLPYGVNSTDYYEPKQENIIDPIDYNNNKTEYDYPEQQLKPGYDHNILKYNEYANLNKESYYNENPLSNFKHQLHYPNNQNTYKKYSVDDLVDGNYKLNPYKKYIVETFDKDVRPNSYKNYFVYDLDHENVRANPYKKYFVADLDQEDVRQKPYKKYFVDDLDQEHVRQNPYKKYFLDNQDHEDVRVNPYKKYFVDDLDQENVSPNPYKKYFVDNQDYEDVKPNPYEYFPTSNYFDYESTNNNRTKYYTNIKDLYGYGLKLDRQKNIYANSNYLGDYDLKLQRPKKNYQKINDLINNFEIRPDKTYYPKTNDLVTYDIKLNGFEKYSELNRLLRKLNANKKYYPNKANRDNLVYYV